MLAAFVAGNFLLIYVQYNSAKNVNNLIEGNEKVLTEIDVTNNLRDLNRAIVSMDNRTGSVLYAKDSSTQKNNNIKVITIQSYIDNLQKISDDDSSVKYIDVLDLLVHKKLLLGKNTLAILDTSTKNTGAVIIASGRVKELNDSIRLVTHFIENSRHKLLAKVTVNIDKSGRKALNSGTTLILLVLMSGAVLFWIIIVTLRKQTQLILQLNISEKKVKEAAKLKEKFMANMSHEIRTPMNAILGFTNLLKSKNIDSESKLYVQTILKSGENLLTIINDILDLSKIEAGMMRIESAPFSIRNLVQSIEIMFKAKTDEKQLKLLVAVDESLPDILEGDATRLTQILVNLMDNAIKFTSKGSIEIKIINEAGDGKIIKTGITVSDTGIGIEKVKLQTVFERFQQAEDSVTRKYGGTGLGLSIVNDLVLLQNGTITVESESGKGTSFHLVIPFKISSEEINTISLSDSSTIIKTDFENICVLVVEDNEINQSLIKHLFKSWQLDFDLATNGKEAIDKLILKKYNLILMDIQMPEMDGYTATQEIRNKLKSDIPIIAMTAHALEGEREKCLSYGMNEYISKPIREQLLHKLITQFIHIKVADVLQKKEIANVDTSQYKYINLQYMKEVSNGNTGYEKTVTEQFIEAIPDNLTAMEKAWKSSDITSLQQLAHNMKTTISVMGLNKMLQPYLDAIEYEKLNEEFFWNNFLPVKSICDASVKEAKQFYSTR